MKKLLKIDPAHSNLKFQIMFTETPCIWGQTYTLLKLLDSFYNFTKEIMQPPLAKNRQRVFGLNNA